jgi:sugar-specific transcriptional regulator TrmB
MGLSLLNLPPDPQAQLRSLQQELYNRNRQLEEAEEALRREKRKTAAIEAGVQQLRTVLSPLYQALQMVFGEIEAMGISGDSPTPRVSAVWESWKQKLGGQTAEAIDVLALHGEMNAEQLRIHLRCARTHVYNVISRLNKAGIINKNGGKISLKEL